MPQAGRINEIKFDDKKEVGQNRDRLDILFGDRLEWQNVAVKTTLASFWAGFLSENKKYPQ